MMAGKPVAARGQAGSSPGGAGSRSAGAPRRRDRRRSGGAVLRRQPRLPSAAARAPFATPSDRWWPADESGFTPRRLAPHEAHELLALGLGLTSLVRRPTVGVAELAQAEFVEGGRLLRRRVLARRPRWLAVLGVTAYRAAFGLAGRGSRSPGGHDRVDEALDTAQSERPQRALSSPGARHPVRPAAGGRGSPRPVQAARRPDVMPRKGRTGRDGLAGERSDVVPAAPGPCSPSGPAGPAVVRISVGRMEFGPSAVPELRDILRSTS